MSINAKVILIIVATVVWVSMTTGLSLGVHYTWKTKSNYQKCQWVGDFTENECIRYHIFTLVKEDTKITVNLDPEICINDNPYQTDEIYRCAKIPDQDQYRVQTEDEYQSTYPKGFLILVCLLTMVAMSLPGVIFIFINSDGRSSDRKSPPRSLRRSPPKSPPKSPPRSPPKSPRRSKMRENTPTNSPAKISEKSQDEFYKQMPVW